MITWGRVLLVVLQLAKAVSDRLQQEQLLSLGEQQAAAKALAAIATKLRVANDVEMEISRLSDDGVRERLRDDFRD